MERVELKVTVKGIYSYRANSFSGYGMEIRYIYRMVDDNGKVYVWKTTTFMGLKSRCDEDEECFKFNDAKGRWWKFTAVTNGSVIKITASIKGESEYNGEEQTELTRVTVKEIISRGKTEEEIEAEKEQAIKAKRLEQLKSLKDGDVVWDMPYKQFKERYADCEKLAGSYVESDGGYGVARITVIIREGRLKASGVRGKHFHSYGIGFVKDGHKYTTPYVAIDEDHATARFEKDFPNIEYEVERVYW